MIKNSTKHTYISKKPKKIWHRNAKNALRTDLQAKYMPWRPQSIQRQVVECAARVTTYKTYTQMPKTQKKLVSLGIFLVPLPNYSFQLFLSRSFKMLDSFPISKPNCCCCCLACLVHTS